MNASSVMMPAWAVTFIAAVVIGLIGLVWRDLIRRIDKIDHRLDTHVEYDARAHERITALEIIATSNTQAGKDNADRLHRFMVETRLAADAHYKWITEQFSQLHKWLNERVLEHFKR